MEKMVLVERVHHHQPSTNIQLNPNGYAIVWLLAISVNRGGV